MTGTQNEQTAWTEGVLMGMSGRLDDLSQRVARIEDALADPALQAYLKLTESPVAHQVAAEALLEAHRLGRRDPLSSALDPHEHEPSESDERRWAWSRRSRASGINPHVVIFCKHCNEPIEMVEAGGHADAVWRLVKAPAAPEAQGGARG